MIRYSPRAARALGYLKRPFNDIEIYVEDTRCYNMWVSLIRASIGNQVRLKSVNQLGGRKQVEEACARDQVDDGRRRLYIIDADLDFMIGKRKRRLKFLYRLKAYCVENIILSEPSLRQLLIWICPEQTQDQSAAILDFQRWEGIIDSSFRRLFVLYAVAKILSPELTTVGYSVRSLCDNTNEGISPSAAKIKQRRKQVLAELLLRHSKSMVMAEIRAVKARVKARPIQEVISGKDYIFPIVYLRLKRLMGYQGRQEQLKVQLATYWSSGAEPWLHRRLAQLAR